MCGDALPETCGLQVQPAGQGTKGGTHPGERSPRKYWYSRLSEDDSQLKGRGGILGKVTAQLGIEV